MAKMARHCSKSPFSSHFHTLEEPRALARLLAESYIAVNVAPLFGQRPETYGMSHAPWRFPRQVLDNLQNHMETGERRRSGAF